MIRNFVSCVYSSKSEDRELTQTPLPFLGLFLVHLFENQEEVEKQKISLNSLVVSGSLFLVFITKSRE